MENFKTLNFARHLNTRQSGFRVNEQSDCPIYEYPTQIVHDMFVDSHNQTFVVEYPDQIGRGRNDKFTESQILRSPRSK